MEGDFEAGDAVDVAAAGDGQRAGREGDLNYSAADLRSVKGLKSAGARAASARERGSGSPRLLRAGLSAGRPSTCRPSFCARPPEGALTLASFGGDEPATSFMATRTESVASLRAREGLAALATLTDRRTRALAAIAARARGAVDEIIEANAGDLEDGRAAGLDAALLDRLALERAARPRRWPTACARSSRCPTRSARSSSRARSTTGSSCASSRAARRRRDRLRGPAERHRRRRGARDQVRQRGRAARLLDGGALERGAREDRGRRGRGRRAAGGLGVADRRRRPRGPRELARQDGLVDLSSRAAARA